MGGRQRLAGLVAVVLAVVGLAAPAPASASAEDPAPSCDQAVGNLITNCGFELDRFGWVMSNVGRQSSVAAGAGRHGAGFVSYQGPHTGEGWATLSQTVPVVPFSHYELTFLVRGPQPEVVIVGGTKGPRTLPDVGDGWDRYSAVIESDGTGWLQIDLDDLFISTVDDVTLTPLAPAPTGGRQFFVHTGGEQTYTIPPNASALRVLAVGSRGAGLSFDRTPIGGRGARVEATIPIPLDLTTLVVEVGGPDVGGAGITENAGGGASSVRRCSAADPGCSAPTGDPATDPRLVVAGGGGGGGGRVWPDRPEFEAEGGDAGAMRVGPGDGGSARLRGSADRGGTGGSDGTAGGAGGELVEGGRVIDTAPSGGAGVGGGRPPGRSRYLGGGGGGGWFGGGSGMQEDRGQSDNASGGGGGSSHWPVDADDVSMTPDDVGTPVVVITPLVGQFVTFTSTPAPTSRYGETYIARVAGGASGQPVTLSTGAGSVACEVEDLGDGAVVTFTDVGPCVVRARQAAGPRHTSATAEQTIQVEPAEQRIEFAPDVPDSPEIGTSFVLTATGGGSGEPVVLTSTSDSGVCVVADNGDGTARVDVVGSGVCRVRATQAGTRTHLPAPRATRVLDLRVRQTIELTSQPPSRPSVGDTYVVTAVTTSGLLVSFAATAVSAGACTLADRGDGTALVSLVGPGTCRVRATQAGDAYRRPAERVVQRFAVRHPQEVRFSAPPPERVVVGDTFVMSASSTTGLPARFSAAPVSAAVCAVTVDGAVTALGPGTCTVRARRPGDATHYPAAAVSQRFPVLAS